MRGKGESVIRVLKLVFVIGAQVHLLFTNGTGIDFFVSILISVGLLTDLIEDCLRAWSLNTTDKHDQPINNAKAGKKFSFKRLVTPVPPLTGSKLNKKIRSVLDAATPPGQNYFGQTQNQSHQNNDHDKKSSFKQLFEPMEVDEEEPASKQTCVVQPNYKSASFSMASLIQSPQVFQALQPTTIKYSAALTKVQLKKEETAGQASKTITKSEAKLSPKNAWGKQPGKPEAPSPTQSPQPAPKAPLQRTGSQKSTPSSSQGQVLKDSKSRGLTFDWDDIEYSAVRALKLDLLSLPPNVMILRENMRDKMAGPLSYEKVSTYLVNGQVHTKEFSMKMTGVYHVGLKNEPAFSETGVWLWHGSPTRNLYSILLDGLQLPSTHRKSLMGDGMYFADRASKSAQYCRRRGEKDKEGYIYLCNVRLGKVLFPSKPNNDLRAAPQGYNAAVCRGENIPDSRFNECYPGGGLLPIGPTVPNNADKLLTKPGKPLKYNEYVVYDPAQIQLKYIVHFKFV